MLTRFANRTGPRQTKAVPASRTTTASAALQPNLHCRSWPGMNSKATLYGAEIGFRTDVPHFP
jgi:hypothetical protein